MLQSFVSSNLILWLCLGFLPSPAWTAPPADSLLPPTTTVLLDTDNIPAVRKAWNETSLGKLFADPSMQPFLDEVQHRNAAAAIGHVPPLGLWWDDVVDLSAGSAAMAIVPDGRKESSLVIIVDTTGNGAAVIRIRKRLALDFTRRKAKIGSLKIDGTSVSIYQYKTGPAAKDPLVTRYYFIKDNLMVVAESEFVVRDLLSRWKDKTKKSLADQKAYQATTLALAVAEPKDIPTIRCYIDPFGLHALRPKPKTKDANAGKLKRPPAPDTVELLEKNGFDAISGIGGVITLGADKQDIVYRVKIHAPGNLNSAAKMLTFDIAKDLSPPAWFPADIASVSSIQWNLPEAFSGYGSWFDVSEGGGEGDFEAILADIKLEKNSPQVDIKKDMVEQLTGPVFSATWVNPADVKAADGKKPLSRWLYAAKVKDEKTVAVALRKMLDGDPDILVPARKIDKSEVWVYGPAGGKVWFGPELADVALTVVQGYAIVASDFGTLKQVLGASPPPAPLAKDSDWLRMGDQLGVLAGKAPAVRQYRRLNQSSAETYALLKAGKIQEDDSLLGQAITLWLDQLVSRKAVAEKKPVADGRRPLIPLKNAKQPAHDLDFKTLPDFSVLQKYLGLFGAQTEVTPEGWQQTGIILAP